MKNMNQAWDLNRSQALSSLPQADVIQHPLPAQARIPVADVNVLKTWYVERQYLIRPTLRIL